MSLNIDDKKNIIKYRVEKSASTIIEAKDNAKLGHWNLVANRLYYALFYMIAALLLDKDIQFKSHAGAIRAIGLNFVSEYRYDARGRVTTKILPGAEYIEYWHDKADRVICMQDASYACETSSTNSL